MTDASALSWGVAASPEGPLNPVAAPWILRRGAALLLAVRLWTTTGNPRYFESLGVPKEKIPAELYAAFEGAPGEGRDDHTLDGPIAVRGAEQGDKGFVFCCDQFGAELQLTAPLVVGLDDLDALPCDRFAPVVSSGLGKELA